MAGRDANFETKLKIIDADLKILNLQVNILLYNFEDSDIVILVFLGDLVLSLVVDALCFDEYDDYNFLIIMSYKLLQSNNNFKDLD